MDSAESKQGMNLPDRYDPAAMPLPYEAPAGPAARNADRVDLPYLFTLIRRRYRLLLLIAAAALALAALWTAISPKVYTASADTVIITQPVDVVPEDRAEADTPTSTAEVDTQLELIRSRAMAGAVFDRLALGEDAEFRADILDPRGALDNLKVSLGLGRSMPAVAAAPADPVAFRERGVNFLKRALNVQRMGQSYTIRIAISDSDPDRAARIANAYANLYTTDDATMRATQNATAAQVLLDRLAELRDQATSDYRAVQQYRIANGLLSQSATSLTEQEISTYNQQIAEARATASEDGARLASARGQMVRGGPDSVGEATTSAVVSALRGQRAQLVTREADLATRYLDSHPELTTVRQQIRDIDSQINAEVGRSIRALEARAQSSAERLASLLASRGTTKAQLAGDNSALVQLVDLERRAAASQSLYESYLNRYKEIVARSGAEQPNARLVSPAQASLVPSSPLVFLNLILGLVIGLLFGTIAAIATELAYRGITTGEDIEQRLGLRSLGFVPHFRTIKPHGVSAIETVLDYPDGAFAETLRNLMTSLGANADRTRPDASGRVIAITSSVPNEGKTTLTSALGQLAARSGRRVLMLDCDIMRADLTKTFAGAYHGPGLHAALHDETAPFAVAALGDHFDLLPIAVPFPRGERLTEEGRLHRLIARARDDYDIVLLDCPPILPIAEVREIVRLADHVVLAVRWRKTIDKVVESAVKQLPLRALRDVGAVLTMVDMKKRARFGGGDTAAFYSQYSQYYRK